MLPCSVRGCQYETAHSRKKPRYRGESSAPISRSGVGSAVFSSPAPSAISRKHVLEEMGKEYEVAPA
eukprot:COSAG06_NODE_237_length_19433_cov_92.613961_5_plen_67_part_00